MPTVTRNFRLDEKLVGDLISLAEKENRSLNNFVANELQKIVDNVRGEKIANSTSVTTTHLMTKDEIKDKFGDVLVPPTINDYDAFVADIKATTYSGDLQKVMKEVERSALGAANKAKLRSIADTHRINFTN